MSYATPSSRVRRLLALTSLLLWAYSAYDQYMTLSGDPRYLADYPPELVAWLRGTPLWRMLWGSATNALGIAGSVYLLLRRPRAVPFLALAFVSLTAGVAYDFLAADAARYYGMTGMIASAVLVLFTGTVAAFARFALRPRP